MKRTDGDLVVIALAVLAVIVFMWLSAAGPKPVKSDSIQAWTPLATSAFLPIDPIVRPIHVDPTPKLRETAQPSPTHAPRVSPPAGGIGTAVGTVKGSASYYAYVPGGAAAAARLRDAIGPNWRGRRVTVWYGKRHVSVVLSDFERSTIPGRLIDLNEGSFAALVGPGWHQRGRVWVEVTW